MAFVKSASHWLFFDDETVEPISEAMVQTAFGSPQVSTSDVYFGFLPSNSQRKVAHNRSTTTGHFDRVQCAWQEFSSSMDHGYILMYERQRPGERADADADMDASGGGSGDSEMMADPSPPGSLA